jgi:hypothetical protein
MRLGPAAERGREGPQDAGVEDAALAGVRIRPAVHGDGSKEAALLGIDRPGCPVGEDVPAQLSISRSAQQAESMGRGHERILASVVAV